MFDYPLNHYTPERQDDDSGSTETIPATTKTLWADPVAHDTENRIIVHVDAEVAVGDIIEVPAELD